jgi:hypothetical protein
MNTNIFWGIKFIALVRERTTPIERPPLVSELSAKLCSRGCCVVRVTDPYGRIFCYLQGGRYFIF